MIDAFELGVGLSLNADGEDNILNGLLTQFAAFDSALSQLQTRMVGLRGEIADIEVPDFSRRMNVLTSNGLLSTGDEAAGGLPNKEDAFETQWSDFRSLETLLSAFVATGKAALQKEDSTASDITPMSAENLLMQVTRDAAQSEHGYSETSASMASWHHDGRRERSDSDWAMNETDSRGSDLVDAARVTFASAIKGHSAGAGDPLVGRSPIDAAWHVGSGGNSARDPLGRRDESLPEMELGFAGAWPHLAGSMMARPARPGILGDEAPEAGLGFAGGGDLQAALIALGLEDNRLSPLASNSAPNPMLPLPPVAERNTRSQLMMPEDSDAGGQAERGADRGSSFDRSMRAPGEGNRDASPGENMPLIVHTSVQLDGDIIARAVGERLVTWMNGPLAGSGAFDPRRSYTPVGS